MRLKGTGMAFDFKTRLAKFEKIPFDPTSKEEWAPLLQTSVEQFALHSGGRSKARGVPGYRVDIAISEDVKYNALATTDDKGDLVVTSANLPLALEAIFKRALCFKSVIPFAGSFDEDHIDPEPVNRSDLIYFLDSNVPRIGFPSDETRSRLASHLTVVAMDFVFEHELGHIWNGHTSLFRSHGLSAIEEIEKKPDSRIPKIDLQTLEMDADAFAGTAMSGRTYSEHTWLPAFPKWEDEFGVGSTYLMLRMFAVYLALRCMDEAATLAKVEMRKHPPIYVRHFIILASWMGAISRSTGRDVNELYKMHPYVAGAAENTFAALTGREVDLSGLNMAFSAEAREYHKSLLKNWALLRPQLDTLKRGGNLAPVSEF